MKSLMRTRPAFAGLLLAALAGCGGGIGDSERYATLPPEVSYAKLCGLPAASEEAFRVLEPSGGHCIAKTAYVLKDAGRADPYSSNPLDRREMELKIWYPVREGGPPRAEYANALTVAGMEWDYGRQAPLVNARAGTAMAEGRRYPVVLFAPGLGYVVEAYTALAEDLASHGYIVVGINHGRISGVITGSDGASVRNERGEDDEGSDDMLAVLVQDQKFVLDWLEQRNGDSAHLLGGHMDLARIGAYGHSIGGATAVQLLRQDVRVRAAINLDGTVYGDLSEAWRKPFMLVSSERAIDPSYSAIMERQTGMGSLDKLEGFGHGDFADIKSYFEAYNRLNTPKVVLRPDMHGPVGGEAALRAVRQKVRLFFAGQLQQAS